MYKCYICGNEYKTPIEAAKCTIKCNEHMNKECNELMNKIVDKYNEIQALCDKYNSISESKIAVKLIDKSKNKSVSESNNKSSNKSNADNTTNTNRDKCCKNANCNNCNKHDERCNDLKDKVFQCNEFVAKDLDELIDWLFGEFY